MVSFCEQSVDDLLHEALGALLRSGQAVRPTRGENVELRGVRLELTDPRARLSRSQTRGRVFSCLGELVWYLAGSNEVEHIAHYVERYRDEAEPDGTVHAAYGTRLFGAERRLQTAVDTLRSRPESRQVVVPLLDADDLSGSWKHTPCTSTLQFMRRDDLIDMVVYMRSNDAYFGLPHDVFAFTMIQELVARSVDAELGTYVHMVGSLHLYDKHRDRAEAFLAEGFASLRPMPAMPLGDPWPAIEQLVTSETEIRAGGVTAAEEFSDPYWADLARLLGIFALFRSAAGLDERITELRRSMNSDVYGVFLNDKFDLLET